MFTKNGDVMTLENRVSFLANQSLLKRLQLRSMAELLGDAGVQDAVALLSNKPPAAADLARMLIDADERTSIAPLPLNRLRRLSQGLREQLPEVLGVDTVGKLAQAAGLIEHMSRLEGPADPFDEAPSAPRDLIPRAIGAISASSTYTQFVRERPLALADLKITIDVDEDLIDTVDERLLAAFQFDRAPTIHLGYMASFRQDWVNEGTFLGEPLQSIGLAPGETRRIAVVDWQRKERSRRNEDTDVSEQIDNVVTHTRALREVISATAGEVQSGGTDMAAGTLAAAVGAVGSIGVSAAIGAGIGAAAGAPIAGLGALPGALIGLGVGAVAGAIGVAVTGSANAQLGHVESDSSGDRDVTSNFTQRINDVSSQHATSLRSVMSTVVVSSEQAERENLSTRAIANHNHAHALTIQYFEVLQHYRSRVSLNGHQALLFLPMKPLTFDADLIMAHWDTLRLGFEGRQRSSLDAMIRVARRLAQSPLLAPGFSAADVEVTEFRLRGLPRQLGHPAGSPLLTSARADLTGMRCSFSDAQSQTLRWSFSGKSAKAKDLEGLRPGLLTQRILSDHASSHEALLEVTLNVSPARVVSWRLPIDSNFTSLPLGVVQAIEDAVDDERSAEDRADDLVEVVRAVSARPYRFTRLLVLSLEPEQLREIMEALVLTSPVSAAVPVPPAAPTAAQPNRSTSPAAAATAAAAIPAASALGRARDLAAKLNESALRGLKGPGLRAIIRDQLKPVARRSGVPLSKLIDPLPFGLTDGMLVFKMRTLSKTGHTAEDFSRVGQLTALAAWRDYPGELAQSLPPQLNQGSERSIFLPTGGHFAEAILGRSIAAERLDGTRHIHWHELPNPLMASEIAALSAGSRAQPLPNLDPTQPGTVLTPSAPTSLPDPTLGSAALAVLGQANLFRDMSKTSELVGVLGNLSTLANNMGSQAGQLAGSAQAAALQQSGALAQQVAGLTSQLLQQQMSNGLPSNATATQRAVAGNRLEDLLTKPLSGGGGLPTGAGGALPSPLSLPGAEKGIAQAFGAPVGNGDARESLGSLPLPAEQSGFLVPKGPFPEKGDAGAIRENLPEALRAPTDSGVSLDKALREASGDSASVAAARINELFITELQPLLDAALGNDDQLDRALRLTLDLEGLHQRAGLSGANPLARAASALARAWRASLSRALRDLSGSQFTVALKRLEQLIAIAQAGFQEPMGLGDAEVDIGALLKQAGVVMSLEELSAPSEVHAGQTVTLSGVIRLKIGATAAASVAGARLKVLSLQTLEGNAEVVSDPNGRFTLSLTHDPLHLGSDSNGPKTPDLDLTVSLLALHPASDALQSEKAVKVPGALTSQLIAAVFDDDGSNALAGSVVVTQPRRAIRLTFQTLSAGVPVRNAPVQSSVNGGAQVLQVSSRTGQDDARGLSGATVLPGAAGSGVSFVALITQLPDGRSVAARADLQGP